VNSEPSTRGIGDIGKILRRRQRHAFPNSQHGDAGAAIKNITAPPIGIIAGVAGDGVEICNICRLLGWPSTVDVTNITIEPSFVTKNAVLPRNEIWEADE
jgi:hypothetical protein